MGTITNRSGKPMDGAVVELYGLGHSRKFETKADGNGFFGISDLPPGRYLVKLNPQSGLAPVKQVKVTAGKVVEVKMRSIRK